MSLLVDLNDLENSCNELEAKLSSAHSTNVSATAGKSKGVSAEYLSKIWCIDIDTARRTINSTTQRLRREDPDHLRRQYATNDRMLRYKRINTYFFMDTLAVTKPCISTRKN